MTWAVQKWLGHRVQSGDLVVIYYAGQAANGGDRTLLLPIDAKADDLDHTGWALGDSIDEIAKKNSTMVLWLDTSPAGRPQALPGQTTDPLAGNRFLNRLTRWPGVTAWLAADGQPCVEGPGHSPFLAGLAQGLGTRPGNLLSCLNQMQQDPALKKQGFRVRGGIPAELTVWPADLLPEHKFQPELLLQQGHADVVTAVAPSPDGELLVTASMDSTIRIWRVRDRESLLLHVLPYHMIGVTAMALSPDGRFLASGDGTGQVRVWDLVEHRERRLEGPPPHKSRIAQIVFLPGKDGNRFVSLEQDGQSMSWDASGPVLRVKPLGSAEIVRLAGATREGGVALALAQEPDGKVLLIGNDGNAFGPPLEGTGVRPTALNLAPDGRRLAVGDEDGRVRVWDVPTRAIVSEHPYDDRISALRLDPSGTLIVGAGDALYLASAGQKGPGVRLQGVDQVVTSAVFSADGQWLAALTKGGEQNLWNLADKARPERRTLVTEGKSSGLTCLAFTGDGRRLIAGEADGGVRSWELASRRPRPTIAPHRGKVDRLDATVDGRYLLEINDDRQALIWDLKHGRVVKPLPGRWIAGVFLPDGGQLAMIRDAKVGGDVVLVDRESGRIGNVFERPRAQGSDQRSRVNFSRIAVSSDGKKVAASAIAGHDEITCVWNVRGGQPKVIRGHTRSLTALAFSRDGRLLLTASEDGTAKVWDLALDGAALERPMVELPDSKARGNAKAREITAAQMSPADPRRIVTAQKISAQLSLVTLWDYEGKTPARSRSLGEIQGRIHAVVFAPDGRWVGAAGQDRMMHFWTLAPGQPPARVQFEPGQQHTEQVNALTAWPTSSMFASGSDDTTIRLWGLDPKTRKATLMGTLVAAPAVRAEQTAVQNASRESAGADWVAYTPEGVFDSSLNGDRLVSFVLNREVKPLEQFQKKFHKFQLTEDLRKGIRPEPPAYTQPPGLVIDPPDDSNTKARDAELKVSLADPSLDTEDLRLYQNGVPVRAAHEFRRLDAPGQFAVKVRLRGGVNRFYAMAGRREDVDARSEDVDLCCDQGDSPSRLHVLALGVKNYERNALRFADIDARRIADHIYRNGVGDAESPGEKIVLTDAAVTERKVEDAFTRIRRAVKGRPEDTVVIFLAGHTDVLKGKNGRERFSLLLQKFPFPADAPLLAANRGVGLGDTPNLPVGVDLPFYAIYRNLSSLDALQRLVIIDACQAEAIFDDPGVHQVEQFKLNEKESRDTRTSYILAARRGELANESDVLGHGLLTYVLLRGMQAPGLRPLPADVSQFDQLPDADTNNDGVVSTQELREYADRGLVTLARLPELAQRGGTEAATSSPPAPENPRVQASDAVFGLVTLPKKERGE